jgi:hypothetical protein
MRVRCAHHDVARQYSAPRADSFARGNNYTARYYQRVDADQRNPARTLSEHSRPNLAWIMERAVVYLSVTTRLFHADIRRNVALCKSRVKKPVTARGHLERCASRQRRTR